MSDAHGTLGSERVAGVHRFDPLTGRFERLADRAKHRGTSLAEVTRNSRRPPRSPLVCLGEGDCNLQPRHRFIGGVFICGTSSSSRRRHIQSIARGRTRRCVGCEWGTSLPLRTKFGETHRVPMGDNDQELVLLRSTRDRSGVYSFATQMGVWSYDPETHQWKAYRHDAKDPSSLPDDRLRAIMADDAGRIWAGTIFAGLCYLDPTTGAFHSVKPTGEGMKNARYEGVSSILRDRSGLMWVGYDGAGLVKINKASTGKFRHILPPPSGANASGDNFFESPDCGSARRYLGWECMTRDFCVEQKDRPCNTLHA